VALERGLRRFDDPRMVGEAEVIVRAEVQDGAAALHPDDRSLRPLDDPFALEKALLVQRLGLLVEMTEIRAPVHGALK